MAKLEKGIVVNIEWHNDQEPNSQELVEIEDRPIKIGYTYDGSDFYNEQQEKVLNYLENLQLENEELKASLNEYETYYAAVEQSIKQ